MKGKYRLTPLFKLLILLLVLAAIGGGVFGLVKAGVITTSSNNGKEKSTSETSSRRDTASTSNNGSVSDTNTSSTKTNTSTGNTKIRLSLDEWVGYGSIMIAKEKGFYDEEGLDVEINIINDATQSSNALIANELDAAGYTINRTAFLSSKFKQAGVDVIFPFITNFSNGGDGIIAKSSITSVNDLVGAKIGVPAFSESETLVVWFVQNSNLSDSDKKSIIDNLILFATSDDTAKAFFAGELDVAATWEPYLSQAEDMTDSHIFFSTASSRSLIMSGVTFRKDFADANPDAVSKFIRATLKASDYYTTDFDAYRKYMPMFQTASDQDIIDQASGAALTTWADNQSLLNGSAKDIYNDMCDIWTSLGETVDKNAVNDIFNDSYIMALESEYKADTVQKAETETKTVVVTEENKQDIIDAESLLTQSATVTFVINTAKFENTADATAKLDAFIKTAKILDGTIIEIAGNTDPNPNSDPQDTANKLLSEQRAETVKKYFVMQGIDVNRIITVGNGSSNPMYPNDTDEHRALNRRTDVSFKIIE